MTAVAAPRRRGASSASAAPHRRRGAPSESPRPRRHLRAVETPRADAPAHRYGALRFLGLVAFVVILSVVVFHVVMAQRGFELQTLREQIEAEQTNYEQLRLETARLSAPERIEAEATDRLGMVRPQNINYLEAPIGAGDAGTPSAPASTLADPDEWAAVKSHLNAEP